MKAEVENYAENISLSSGTSAFHHLRTIKFNYCVFPHLSAQQNSGYTVYGKYVHKLSIILLGGAVLNPGQFCMTATGISNSDLHFKAELLRTKIKKLPDTVITDQS